MRDCHLERSEQLRRLRLIEGQVRGLQRMIAADAGCIDVLTQTSAVTHALNQVALGLVDEHIRRCVREATIHGTDAETTVAEATSALARLIRS